MTTKYLVVNIGDVGRSPRTANHIVQISKLPSSQVDYLCFLETEVPSFLQKPNINLVFANTRINKLVKKLPSIVYFFLRIFLELITFFFLFCTSLRKKYDNILIQNPYCLSFLLFLPLYKLFSKHTRVVIDVHNFGYSLLSPHSSAKTNTPAEQSSASPARKYLSKFKRILVAVYKFSEVFLVRFNADRVLTVSKAMKAALIGEWRIPQDRVFVLYDLPDFSKFHKLSLNEKHDFLSSIKEFQLGENETISTEKDSNGEVTEKTSKNLLGVISSSWGLDDDFETLIEALKILEERKSFTQTLYLFFTGSGPRKSELGARLLQLSSKKIVILIKWLHFSEYTSLIGSADFTISVHKSSTGLDLPIKILDSFACEVPVLAFNYAPTLAELVDQGNNGFFYNNAEELADLIANFNKKKSWSFPKSTWEKEWAKAVMT